MKPNDNVIAARARHWRALETLSKVPTSGLALWRKLRRIESLAHAAAEARCNGVPFTAQSKRTYDFCGTEDAWDNFCTREILPAVARVLGRIPDGFFINADPRGYALKIRTAKCNDGTAEVTAALPDGMQTDWGSYGILAPETN